MFKRSNGHQLAVDPFMKWVGGKRWLFKRYRHLFPENIVRLIDPFVGGGSSFFLLQPSSALLGDVNSDLIEIYECVRNQPRELARCLAAYQENHGPELYYAVRAHRPKRKIERAARLLYLNRTCWNGLFRVNQKGEFNVPIGTKTKIFTSVEELIDASRALSRATLHSSDFSLLIRKAGRGDVVFADPPYFDTHKQNARFVRYNHNVFSWEDQLRLYGELLEARKRGAKCFVTNSNSKALIRIYRDHGLIRVLRRHSVLAADSSARKRSGEILVELN
jgi:DNA adenine methylase